MANARAFIGNDKVGYTFRFNPESVEWPLRQNQQTYDTLGGRVIQLLSVRIETMTVIGSAGSRAELQRMVAAMNEIMTYHINYQRPVRFSVPSRGWEFAVYVSALPRMGWDVETVTFPWELHLEVEEDLGVTFQSLLGDELSRLAKNIGYKEQWHGGNPDAWTQNLAAMSATSASSSTAAGAPVDPSTMPKDHDRIASQLKAGFDSISRKDMSAVVDTQEFFAWVNHESSWVPWVVSPANNAGHTNGGLFQFSWAAHPTCRSYFSDNGDGLTSTAAHGTRFTMSVADQARYLVSEFGDSASPANIRKYGQDVMAGTYPNGWPY